MTDLERLNKALAAHEDDYNLKMVPDHHLEVVDAARAYRDLLANGVKPDYEAALHAAESIDWEYLGPESFLSAVGSVVDAAIGAKLLVDPTTEEEG